MKHVYKANHLPSKSSYSPQTGILRFESFSSHLQTSLQVHHFIKIQCLSYPLHKANLILSASCENVSTDSPMWYMQKVSLGFLIIMSGIIDHVQESLKIFVQASFDMLIAQLHTQNLTLAYHLCEHMCGKPTRHLDLNLQKRESKSHFQRRKREQRHII